MQFFIVLSFALFIASPIYAGTQAVAELKPAAQAATAAEEAIAPAVEHAGDTLLPASHPAPAVGQGLVDGDFSPRSAEDVMEMQFAIDARIADANARSQNLGLLHLFPQ